MILNSTHCYPCGQDHCASHSHLVHIQDLFCCWGLPFCYLLPLLLFLASCCCCWGLWLLSHPKGHLYCCTGCFGCGLHQVQGFKLVGDASSHVWFCSCYTGCLLGWDKENTKQIDGHGGLLCGPLPPSLLFSLLDRYRRYHRGHSSGVHDPLFNATSLAILPYPLQLPGDFHKRHIHSLFASADPLASLVTSLAEKIKRPLGDEGDEGVVGAMVGVKDIIYLLLASLSACQICPPVPFSESSGKLSSYLRYPEQPNV